MFNNQNNGTEEVRAGLKLFTLNGDDGVSNPSSRRIILAMKHMGRHACVYKSIEEAEISLRLKPVSLVVPLYDTDCVGELFFVRAREAAGVPQWAQCYSTSLCVGICLAAAERQSTVEVTAQMILERFALDYDDADSDYYRRERKEPYRRPSRATWRDF